MYFLYLKISVFSFCLSYKSSVFYIYYIYHVLYLNFFLFTYIYIYIYFILFFMFGILSFLYFVIVAFCFKCRYGKTYECENNNCVNFSCLGKIFAKRLTVCFENCVFWRFFAFWGAVMPINCLFSKKKLVTLRTFFYNFLQFIWQFTCFSLVTFILGQIMFV